MLAIISENTINMQQLLEERGGTIGSRRPYDTPFGTLQSLYPCELKGEEFWYIPFNGICEGVSMKDASLVVFAAFRDLKVTDVVSVGLVGSINPLIKVSDIVIPDDFIDNTHSRHRSLIDAEQPGTHHHFRSARPFCPELRQILIESAWKRRLSRSNVFETGVYIGTEGPRFETRAEVRLFQQWGADITGLTVIPEVVYARELNMCYANVSIVLDRAENWDDAEWENLHSLSLQQRHTLNGQIALDAVEGIRHRASCHCHEYWIRQPQVLRPGEDRLRKV